MLGSFCFQGRPMVEWDLRETNCKRTLFTRLAGRMCFSSNGLIGPGVWRKIAKQRAGLRAAGLSQTATDYALVNGAKSTKKLSTVMPHWVHMVEEPRRCMKMPNGKEWGCLLRNKAVTLQEKVRTWCREGELNPQGAKHRRILSPLRLPVPPSRRWEGLFYCKLPQ